MRPALVLLLASTVSVGAAQAVPTKILFIGNSLTWISMAEIDHAPDREHPSLAGTYLATAVVYATVFARDPAPLDYVPAGLSVDDAAFLRRTAFESLQNYRTRR